MMQNPQATYELDLARKLIQVSQVLATQLYPETTFVPYNEQERFIGTWRVKYPDFLRPRISIDRQDVSGQLYGLAQKTNDLLVNMSVVVGDIDEGLGFTPVSYNWEARPTGSLQGLLFFICCPVEIPDNTLQTLKRLRKKEHGYLELEKLRWFDLGDENADTTANENILLSLVKQDTLQNLVVMQWLLDGLTRPREIYREEVYNY